MPPRTAEPLAGQSHAPHAITCVWFWAWAGVGAIATFSLDLGALVALPAFLVIGTLAVAAGGRRCTAAFGSLTGAGLPLLWVAYVQRQGPGTSAASTPGGTTMTCQRRDEPADIDDQAASST